MLAFEGELGAGKTTFIQAIARGLGVAGRATSPTYALVHRYQRAARAGVPSGLLPAPDARRGGDLDWEGLLAEGDAILVEWPERAGAWLPAPARGASGCITWRTPPPRARGAVMLLAIETATDRASVALGTSRRTRSSARSSGPGGTRRSSCR